MSDMTSYDAVQLAEEVGIHLNPCEVESVVNSVRDTHCDACEDLAEKQIQVIEMNRIAKSICNRLIKAVQRCRDLDVLEVLRASMYEISIYTSNEYFEGVRQSSYV